MGCCCGAGKGGRSTPPLQLHHALPPGSGNGAPDDGAACEGARDPAFAQGQGEPASPDAAQRRKGSDDVDGLALDFIREWTSPMRDDPLRGPGGVPDQRISASMTSGLSETIGASASGLPWTPQATGRVCVVLDFDLTLAHIHVYKELRKMGFGASASGLGKERIFGGADRLESLSGFLKRLRGRDAHVAVLTNNSEEVVNQCLRIGGLSGLVDEVMSVRQTSDKGRDMRRLRPAGVTRWVFVDDDARNIRCVLGATRERVPCILIDGGEGMQQRHIDAIEAAAFPPELYFPRSNGSGTAQPGQRLPSLHLPHQSGRSESHRSESRRLTSHASRESKGVSPSCQTTSSAEERPRQCRSGDREKEAGAGADALPGVRTDVSTQDAAPDPGSPPDSYEIGDA